MFKRLDENPAETVSITIDGTQFDVPAGETVAAAVLASGVWQTRTTVVSGSPRAPFCLMGVCYECLMVIDGKPNQRACREVVNDGMRIESQDAAGQI
jgi:predicted molibdopterin-dependent oxidoreductase YjgC